MGRRKGKYYTLKTNRGRFKKRIFIDSNELKKLTKQEDNPILNQEVVSDPDGDETLQIDSTLSDTVETNVCAKENLSNQDVVTGLQHTDSTLSNTEEKNNFSKAENRTIQDVVTGLQHIDSTLSNTEEANVCAKENQDVVTGQDSLQRQRIENFPKYCVVPGCSRNEVANPELTFFSIPYELKYRKIWCESIGRQDLWDLPAPEMFKYYFCNRHFANQFFFRFQSKLVLLKTATPTLELPSIKKVEFKPRKFEGKCSVETCENSTKDNPDLQFFCVPNKREVYSKWFRNIGVTRFCRYSVCKFAVCEEHFEKRYLKIDRKGNNVVMPYAEPTLKLPIPYEEIKDIEPPDFRKRSNRLATPNEAKSANSHTNEEINNSELQKEATEFVDLNKINENLNDPLAKRKKKLSRKGLKRQRNAEKLNNDNYFFYDDSDSDDDDDKYNTDDPNLSGKEYDSLSEANIKKEETIIEEQKAFNIADNMITIENASNISDNMITVGNASNIADNIITIVNASNISDNMITVGNASNIADNMITIENLIEEESDTKPPVDYMMISTSLGGSGNVELLVNPNNSTQSIKEEIKTIYQNASEEAKLLFDLCDVYCKEKTAFKLKLKEEILLDD